MPDTPSLIVLILQEAGMRSTLAARFSLSGAAVITASSVQDPVLARHVRHPAILVIDEAMANGDLDDWIDLLRAEERWGWMVVIVGDDPGRVAGDDHLVFVPRDRAMAEIPAIVARWTR